MNMKKLLEKSNNPDKSRLSKLANAKGMLLIDKEEHAKLTDSLKNPSIEFLKIRQVNMGMLLYQMRNTRSCLVILNLQILSIWKKKCHDRNMSILPTTDLKQLKTVFAGPSIDFLKEHSAKANYELIPRSEYEILKILLIIQVLNLFKPRHRNMVLWL